MENKPDNTMTFQVGKQRFTNNDVDLWELKAARRGLMNIKSMFSQQEMLTLLSKQIEESDAYHHKLIANYHGEYRVSHVDMHVENFNINQLLTSLSKQIATGNVNLSAQLAAHPEHYTMPLEYNGILETIGGLVTRLKVTSSTSFDDVPEKVKQFAETDYTISTIGILKLDDDSPFAYAIHQMRNNDDNSCDLSLKIVYPKSAPDQMITEHTEHLAIEFRSYIRQAENDNK